ncbi:MAG: DUF1292 domain-containing protein [Lachnospiraceae bacterium]
MEKVKFEDPQTGDVVEFYVLEQTSINGAEYLLVTEKEEGDCEAYILRALLADTQEEVSYVMVEDDAELEAVSGIFEEMLEDVDFEK